MADRLERVRELIATEGLDALVITEEHNIRYLSGFTSPDCVLVISASDALLVTDFRYFEQVRQQAPSFALVQISDTLRNALAGCVAAAGYHRLGIESQAVTVKTYDEWKEALPTVEWVSTTGLVEGLRQIKEPGELEAIIGAVRIADEAMAHLYDWLRPGVTERQASWELETYMRTHGAEALSFTIIVGSGPNGAMSHAVTTDRAIQRGDPVVVDMGALYNGYCSDITRSFCLGEAGDQYRQVWSTVFQAQLAAEAALKAGLSGVDGDAVARKLIYAAGYEGKFGHGLGHGVGLAIHEDPRMSFTSKHVLAAGSVVTVEPGIYFPDWGGVRIEDVVLVQEGGCRVLTQAAKRMVV